MILTPTYHVFDMYKVHQDAELLDLSLETGSYKLEGSEIPAVTATASRDAEGKIHLSFCNLQPHANTQVTIDIRGLAGSSLAVTGTTLTGDSIDAHNTFAQPEAVKPQPFESFQLDGGKLTVDLPAKSVTTLELAARD